MPEFPGQLSAGEQQDWIDRFRRMAVERWGEARVTEMADALSETAIACGAVLKLDLIHDEPPGFYLAAQFDHSAGEWRIG